MNWIRLDEKIQYLPSAENPLSAEVVLVEGQEHLWLFDVGCGDPALDMLRRLPQKPRVVLSHFHPDHMGNLPWLDAEQVYLGKYTCEKAGAGTVVDRPLTLSDGVELRIFPLPSCHAKGSLGLEVNGRYAFLGDGVYSTVKQGRPCYNATLLKDTIDTLSGLQASDFALSHGSPFLQAKADVLSMLKSIYSRRIPNRPEIFLDEIELPIT